MKKQFFIIVLILILPAALIISCTKSSADQQTTTVNCDTAQMKYSTDIINILQNSCYSCHGHGTDADGSGGIHLDSYEDLAAYASGGINSTLYKVINHAPGVPAMPYQSAKLDVCTINKVLDWVLQGAPDN